MNDPKLRRAMSTMSNEAKYYLRGCLESVVVLFIAGGIIQTFFADIGFTAQQIGNYTGLASIVQVVVMILSIFFADTTRNVKGTMALLCSGSVIFCAVMLVPCLTEGVSADTVYWLSMVLCVVRNLMAGFSGILFFRMMYILADPADFSRLESNNTILCGIVSIAASSLVSFLAAQVGFRSIMAAGFIISILFSFGMAWALNSLRPRGDFSPPPAQPFRPAVLWRRDFRFFYLPNLMRGICNGLMGMMTVVFLREISADTATVSTLTAISSVATVVGAWLFNQLHKRFFRTATLYAACSAVMCLLLPLLLIGRSPLLFFILHFVIYCAYASNNIAGALYPSEYVPYEDIGAYTSLRLIVMTLGSALSSYAIPFLLDRMPTAALLTLCGAVQLASGLSFLYYDRRYVRSAKTAS